MTKEEKIKRAKDIICKNCKWNGCDNNACPTLQETIEAIELGLTEGRKEKWHDLREDPDDLPKEDCTEVRFVTKGNETLTGEYKNGGGEGTPIFDTFGIVFYYVEQVIAWCELPKFERVE